MDVWSRGRQGQGWGPRRGPRRGNGGYRGTERGAGKHSKDLGTCRYFQRNDSCKFGSACKFSHDLSPKGSVEHSTKERSSRATDTPEQQQAKADYNSWRRIIKTLPLSGDNRTAEQLWNGALVILNGNDREWKRMVPRDLDDEEYYGREHIRSLLTMQSYTKDYSTFIRQARPFLLVMTHSSFLDCLSVDTFVGALYNFISGTNGTRAIPFFQHLCQTLVNAHLDTEDPTTTTAIETTMIAMSTALRELLRRESRARFNEDLPSLIDSIEDTVRIVTDKTESQTFTIVLNYLGEVRAIVARAKGLLAQEEEHQELPLTTTTNTSTYPRSFVMPRDRHDNDKADITRIKIFPTREEILSDEAEFLPSSDFDQPHYLTDQAERHIDTNFRLLRYDLWRTKRRSRKPDACCGQ